METTSERQIFLDLLTKFKPPKEVDALFVMRNWDSAININRLVNAGVLLNKGFAYALFMLWELNTAEEAKSATSVIEELGWGAFAFLTDQWHVPRTMLSFIRAENQHDRTVFPAYRYNGEVTEEELSKIEKYQASDDIASYREGIQWLQSQTK